MPALAFEVLHNEGALANDMDRARNAYGRAVDTPSPPSEGKLDLES